LRWTGWLSILLAFVLVISGAGSSFARSLLPIAAATDAVQARDKSQKLRYPRSHHEFRHREPADIKGAPSVDPDVPGGQIPIDTKLIFPARGWLFLLQRTVLGTIADFGASARGPPALRL